MRLTRWTRLNLAGLAVLAGLTTLAGCNEAEQSREARETREQFHQVLHQYEQAHASTLPEDELKNLSDQMNVALAQNDYAKTVDLPFDMMADYRQETISSQLNDLKPLLNQGPESNRAETARLIANIERSRAWYDGYQAMGAWAEMIRTRQPLMGLADDLQSAKLDLAELDERKQNLTVRRNKLMAQKSEFEGEYNNYQKEINEKRQEIAALKEKNDKLQDEVKDALAKANQLTEKSAMAELDQRYKLAEQAIDARQLASTKQNEIVRANKVIEVRNNYIKLLEQYQDSIEVILGEDQNPDPKTLRGQLNQLQQQIDENQQQTTDKLAILTSKLAQLAEIFRIVNEQYSAQIREPMQKIDERLVEAAGHLETAKQQVAGDRLRVQSIELEHLGVKVDRVYHRAQLALAMQDYAATLQRLAQLAEKFTPAQADVAQLPSPSVYKEAASKVNSNLAKLRTDTATLMAEAQQQAGELKEKAGAETEAGKLAEQYRKSCESFRQNLQ